MKLVAPDYYNQFYCKASKCIHNCCIGWEIDIDDFSLELYKSVPGALGSKLSANISCNDDGAHFILDKDDRCPFLQSDGLCQLICELGEDSLCDICADHPRFRNYFSDHIEIGIGLSCEEAARIIVTNESDVSLVIIEDDGMCENVSDFEEQFMLERDRIFSLIQDKNDTNFQKISKICNLYNLKNLDNLSKWSDVYLSLEHLTSEWPVLLGKMKTSYLTASDILSKKEYNKPFQNLLHYFIFRHFTPSDLYEDKRAMIGASLLSVLVITAVFFINGNLNTQSFLDISRLYSSEIEYSDTNFERLMLAVKDDQNV